MKVQIECVFKDGIQGASCVLIYQECGSKTLVVKEYTQNTNFPVILTINDDPENYTFVIFGKNGSNIDKMPISRGSTLGITPNIVETVLGTLHQR